MIIYIAIVLILAMIYGYAMETTDTARTAATIIGVVFWPVLLAILVGALLDGLVQSLRA